MSYDTNITRGGIGKILGLSTEVHYYFKYLKNYSGLPYSARDYIWKSYVIGYRWSLTYEETAENCMNSRNFHSLEFSFGNEGVLFLLLKESTEKIPAPVSIKEISPAI